MRHHADASTCVDVVAVDSTQRQSAADEPLQEERANVGFVRRAARQRHRISDLELGRHQRLSIDEADDGPQEEVDEHDESGASVA